MLIIHQMQEFEIYGERGSVDLLRLASYPPRGSGSLSQSSAGGVRGTKTCDPLSKRSRDVR